MLGCLQSHTKHSCELPSSQGKRGAPRLLSKPAGLQGVCICQAHTPPPAVCPLLKPVFPAGHRVCTCCPFAPGSGEHSASPALCLVS